MKVILNKDVYPLGEEGDIKDVAKGYARNYLFPRKLAFAHTEKAIKLFEARRAEIEERKAAKRQDSSFLKGKLENLELLIEMPAGANGKLYGAVTNQTIVDELQKHELRFERKKVEIPGNSIKSIGKYRVFIKLYESQSAELKVVVQAQGAKTVKHVHAEKHASNEKTIQVGKMTEPTKESTAEPVKTQTEVIQ